MAGKESIIKIILQVDDSKSTPALAKTQSMISSLSSFQITEGAKVVKSHVQNNNEKLTSTRKRLTEEEKLERLVNEKILRQKAKELYKERTAGEKAQADSLALLQKRAGSANYALINLTRTISDAPFFFRSFEMGIVAISNNLDPLMESFRKVTADSGGFKNALKDIGKQLAKGGFIVLGFALVNAAMTAFALSQDHAEKKTKKLNDALKKQREELEGLKNAISSFYDVIDPTKAFFGDSSVMSFEDLGKNIQKAKKDVADYDKQLKELDKTEKEMLSPVKRAEEERIAANANKTISLEENRQRKEQNKLEELNIKANIQLKRDEINEERKLANAWYKENSETYNKLADKQSLLNYARQKKYLEGLKKIDKTTGKKDKKTTPEEDLMPIWDNYYNYLEQLEMQVADVSFAKRRANVIKESNLIEQNLIEYKNKLGLTDESLKVARENAAIYIANKNKEIDDDELSRKESYIDRIEAYQIESGNNVLGSQLANLKRWYDKEMAANKKDLDDKIVTEEEYAKAVEELDNTKETRRRNILRQEKVRLKQLRDQELANLREEYGAINALANAGAKTIIDAGTQAFQQIFGEANSLLEQFFANLISNFASLGMMELSKSLFFGALNLFAPGAGAVGAIASGVSSKAIVQTPIMVSLDGKIIDNRVITQYTNYAATAESRRLL